MSTIFYETERRIQAYKVTGRKCETEEDLSDMVRLASENIIGKQHKNNAVVRGNAIDNPEDILSNPDKVAEQLIDYQSDILGDMKCRSRRVNVMTYQINKKMYKIDTEDGIELMEKLVYIYSDYPSVATLTERNGIIRIDHIVSNLGDSALRLTQVFKPQTMYNLYKDLKEEKYGNK